MSKRSIGQDKEDLRYMREFLFSDDPEKRKSARMGIRRTANKKKYKDQGITEKDLYKWVIEYAPGIDD